VITLAADFGGRRIKLGLVRGGEVVAQRILPAEANRPLAERLPVVAEAFENLCATHGIQANQRRGIGFSYPSIIDARSARVLDHFEKYGDASALDLRAWARERMGLPLAIDNDARMALIGEWRHGAGRGSENGAIITLGTGIGVAAVIEGKVLRGVHGQAGILGGHITVRYGGRTCVCGNIGCAEAEASTSVLDALARERADFSTGALSTQQVIDYATLFRAAKAGDPGAQQLTDHSLQVWSALAVSIIHMFDPEVLIFGGGVMGGAEVILPAIQKYVSQHAHTPWGKVRIVPSELGDKSALVACEWLVTEFLENRDEAVQLR
jgi:glucokinase